MAADEQPDTMHIHGAREPVVDPLVKGPNKGSGVCSRVILPAPNPSSAPPAIFGLVPPPSVISGNPSAVPSPHPVLKIWGYKQTRANLLSGDALCASPFPWLSPGKPKTTPTLNGNKERNT